MMKNMKSFNKSIKIALSGILLTVFTFPALMAQEEKINLPDINIGGFIRYEMLYDDYKTQVAREGEITLYPLRRNLDSLGNDLNKTSQLQMFSLQTRVNLKISGMEAMGADITGVVEGDFFGNAESNINTLRLRHSFFKLQWDKTSLVLGQTWHPLFVTECYPEVLSFGAGIPFQPLSRAPQARFDYKISKPFTVSGALLIHSPFRSKGPSDAQINAGIPDSQIQLKFKKENFVIGTTAGYKVLKPRLVTEAGVKTDKKVGSYNLQGFLKAKINKITLKLQSIYGSNLSSYVMIGGYGAQQDPDLVDDYDYVNLRTLSTWGELYTDINSFRLGLFGAYLVNKGANETYHSLGYAMGEDIESLSKISPRISYISDKVTLGIEYMNTSSSYANEYNQFGKASTTDDPVSNNRFLFSAAYKF